MEVEKEKEILPKKQRTKIVYVKKPPLNMQLRNQKNEKPINLLCNLLKMHFNPSKKHAQQFSVKITPEIAVDNYPLVRRIIRSLSKDLKKMFHPYISSGFSIFSSANENDDQMNTLTCKLDDQEYTVEISKTANILDLTKVNTFNENDIRVKSFIEILIKTILSSNKGFIRFDDRSFFDYTNRESLNNGIYKLKGYGTAAVITECGLYLRVNDKSKFISGKSALDKLKELKNKHQNGDFYSISKEYFEGRSVLAQYGSYRIYKIGDVLFDRNVDNTEIPVKQQDGTIINISLFNYYKQQYKIEIKDRAQPLLKELSRGDNEVKNENVRFLIPELVYLCGMDDESLDSGTDTRRRMAEKLTPQQKLNKISEINRLLTNSQKKEIPGKSGDKILKLSPKEINDEWGTNFSGFLHLKGRKLHDPKIQFKGQEVNVEKGRFRANHVIQAFDFNSNSWICITLNNQKSNAEKNIDSLLKCAKNLGIHIEKPNIKLIDARNANQFVDQLRKINFNDGKRLALICLNNHTSNYYPLIKRYLYEQIGIPTQVINMDKSRNQKGLSYFSNVLNQMNVKVGCELYNINIDNNLMRNPSMIIGINSSRAGKNKVKLIMTSSYNPKLSNFLTQIKDSSTEQTELQSTLNSLLSQAIGFFHNKHNRFPEYVIVYRQGGNEKQIQKIFIDELPVFKAFFSGDTNNGGYDSSFKPKFSVISVNKKTDLKFFQTEDDKVMNPPSGTVVDCDVTTPEYFEFYLQPQYVNQGTATPVHFHCIWDTTGMPLEIMEQITFNQTFYYWNWNGPIREPAALKFAEVCSQFNAKVKMDSVPDKLMHTPYYI